MQLSFAWFNRDPCGWGIFLGGDDFSASLSRSQDADASRSSSATGEIEPSGRLPACIRSLFFRLRRAAFDENGLYQDLPAT
jgi:hypothetical protein